MSRDAIFLTGATGVVGMEVLARLVETGDREVIVLLRATDAEAAGGRLRETFARIWDVPPGDARVRAVVGDVSAPGLGMSRRDRANVVASVDRVVHCAAAVGFDQPLDDALAVNTLGTQRVLELAAEVRGLDRVVHVSTAYVSGLHDGRFSEDDLAVGQRFRNSYEQSKHLAERLVAASGLPVVVARPSIVVGDGTTGWTPAFSALYLPLRAFARGLLERVPADPGGIVDVVGLDYVAGALVHLLDAPDVVGRRFHLVAGDRAATVADVIRLAARRFSQPPPTISPLRRSRGTDALVPYFDVTTRFDDTEARAELEPHGIAAQPLDALFERLMDYAEATRWGRSPTTRAAAGAARDRLLAEAA